MKTIFITYGDNNFKKSAKRLTKEAKATGLFDIIKYYQPKDMPDFIKASSLMAFSRLGGYAVWKPYIIYSTYSSASSGDIIVYADAGCTIQNTPEWETFFNILAENEEGTIVFSYRSDHDYGWKSLFGNNASTKNSNWMKKSVKEYFTPMFSNEDWLDGEKVWSGALIVKKGAKLNTMLEEWFKVTLLKPELSIDTFGNELEQQDETFVCHRHDQTLLYIFSYYFKDKQKIIFLPETAESQYKNAAIIASRIRDEPDDPVIKQLNRKIKKLIGKRLSSDLISLKKAIFKHIQ